MEYQSDEGQGEDRVITVACPFCGSTVTLRNTDDNDADAFDQGERDALCERCDMMFSQFDLS